MNSHQARLLELIDRLQAGIEELREAILQGPATDEAGAKAVEAFADEAFRDRDA